MKETLINKIISHYENHELASTVNNILGQSMAPLFKVYYELTRRADSKTHSFTCSVDELAKCLGYSRDDLDTGLLYLLTFGIIDIRIGYEVSTKREITLIIH